MKTLITDYYFFIKEHKEIEEDTFNFHPNDFLNSYGIDDILYLDDIHSESIDLIEKIRHFALNDKTSIKIYKQYMDMLDYSDLVPEEIEKKGNDLELEFHKNLFKHFPNELKNKYSIDYLSKILRKNGSLLI